MKRFFSALSMFLLVMCLFLFSGCSSSEPIVFHSSMNVEANESGSRTITASVSKATLRSLFGSGFSSFQSFIESYCPDSMEWVCEAETSSSYELIFTISFDSLDEYQSKVDSLTTVSDSVSVTRPQVGVTTGFTLTENSDVTALFSWLYNALAERTNAGTAKLSSLMQNGSNTFSYAGREYEQTGPGLYAYVETLWDAEQVDILTDLSLDDTWKRSVRMRFPSQMLDNAANVKNYLSTLLPEGVEESWVNSTTWVLDFPQTDVDTIGKLMSELFQSKDEALFHEDITADTAMHMIHTYEEPINLDFFVPSSGETTVRYFVSNATNASISIPAADGSLVSDFPTVGDSYDGYICLYSETMSTGSLSFTAAYQYQPLEILVDTQIRSVEDLERDVILELGSTPPASHRSLMLSVLQNAADGSAKLTDEEENGLYRILYHASGTVERLDESFLSTFGTEAEFIYERPFKLTMEPDLTAAYQNAVDFSLLLVNPQHTLITSTLHFPSGDKLSGGTDTVTVLSTSGSVSMEGSTSRRNLLRPIVIVFAILAGLFVLYLILTGPVAQYIQSRGQQNAKQGTQKKKAVNAKSRGTSSNIKAAQNTVNKKKTQTSSTHQKKK